MTSMYEELLKVLTDPSVNRIRLPRYKAENAVEAEIDVVLGRAGLKEGGNAQFFSSKIVGKERDNLFLTLCRDVARRNKEDAFGYATRIIASPMLGDRLSHIEVCYNFEPGWHKIDFEGLPVFPEIPEGKEEDFANAIIQARKLMKLAKKMDNRASTLRSNLKKKGTTHISERDHSLTYIDAENLPEVEAIVDSEGLEIGRWVKVEYPNGVCLHCGAMDAVKSEKYEQNDLIRLEIERRAIREEANALLTAMRPFELGIVERLGQEDRFVEIAGVTFEAIREPVKRSQFPNDAGTKLANGEFKKVQRKPKKGHWEFTQVEKPVPA